ncbi:arylsulfatase [Purpureocillium lavendulum]|uniref:Arylsulfatase n=1 Tax=Purpureocillium lavendulum TaxID=1247861 RepID=A0AB34FFE2_9HYPO|nr:arylsulfatase [Purpureocillium lavendulum]
MIITDDQDLHMKSMDFMPHVRSKLAGHGLTFQKHYCTSALCCPSRVSLMTGKCVHNTNVTDVRVPWGAYPKFVSQGLNDDYLPLWLQDAGVNTYYVGKLMNGHSIKTYRNPPVRGWTGSHFLLEPGTYDYLNSTWALDNGDWESHLGVNAIDVTTQHSVDMLQRASSDDKPFFMVVAPAVPHVGINATGNGQTFFPIPQDKWKRAFSDKIVPRTPNWNPATQGSGASWLRNLPRQNASVVDGLDELYRARIRCIAGLDDMVDRLVSVLDEQGILENTHVVFTTDNGYHIGQHRMGPGKKQGYETDINIPMVWRGPGVPSGKVIDAVSTHTDLAPTFLTLFGLPLRDNLDGRTIPAIVVPPQASGSGSGKSNNNKAGEHVNIEMWGPSNPYEVDPYTSIRVLGEKNNTYKGLRVVGDAYSLYYAVWCTNEHELYDVAADAHQTTNLLLKGRVVVPVDGTPLLGLGRPLEQVVARLDALLMVLKTCVGAQCTRPWRTLHPRGDVATLADAVRPAFDAFYARQPRVSFSACKMGYLTEFEGPQAVVPYPG